MFSWSRKAFISFYVKRRKSFLLHGDTGVARGDGGLQGVTAGYKGLQKNCFLTRTSPDTFSWSILHKNQS